MDERHKEHITHREDLAGEHSFGHKGQLILLIGFFIIWIADSFIFKYTTFLQKYIPYYINIIAGLFIILIAYKFVRSAMTNFHDTGETSNVFDDGAFGIVRHPIYTSANLLYIGFVLTTLSIASAAFWIVILLFYIFISKHEEKLLVNKFGEDYLKYKKKVRMIIPRTFKN